MPFYLPNRVYWQFIQAWIIYQNCIHIYWPTNLHDQTKTKAFILILIMKHGFARISTIHAHKFKEYHFHIHHHTTFIHTPQLTIYIEYRITIYPHHGNHTEINVKEGQNSSLFCPEELGGGLWPLTQGQRHGRWTPSMISASIDLAVNAGLCRNTDPSSQTWVNGRV